MFLNEKNKNIIQYKYDAIEGVLQSFNLNFQN